MAVIVSLRHRLIVIGARDGGVFERLRPFCDLELMARRPKDAQTLAAKVGLALSAEAMAAIVALGQEVTAHQLRQAMGETVYDRFQSVGLMLNPWGYALVCCEQADALAAFVAQAGPDQEQMRLFCHPGGGPLVRSLVLREQWDAFYPGMAQALRLPAAKPLPPEGGLYGRWPEAYDGALFDAVARAWSDDVALSGLPADPLTFGVGAVTPQEKHLQAQRLARVDQAAQLLEQKRVVEARDLLAPWQDDLPAEGLRLLALSYRWNGQSIESVSAAWAYAERARTAPAWLFCLVTALRAKQWDDAALAAEKTWDAAVGPHVEHRGQVVSLLADLVQGSGNHARGRDFGKRIYCDDPNDERVFIFYCGQLLACGEVLQAHALAMDFLARFPRSSAAWNLRGAAAQNAGWMAEALDCHRKSFALAPTPPMASNVLYGLQFVPGLTQAEIDREHVQTCRVLWPEVEAPPLAWDGVRPLRIGYLSADFRNHSVAAFAEVVIERHDRRSFEVYCYYDHATRTEMTQQFMRHADHWRSVAGQSDQDVAATIRQDQIDILVDLAGHTGGNRLAVFALRPAPLQVTWLGYPDATGLAAMDARICDAIVDPQDAQGAPERAAGGERLVRLPAGYHCWRPLEGMPDVAPMPPGPPLLGCFGTLTKINPPVLDLWAEVLRAVPEARLLIKTKALKEDERKVALVQEFTQRGIAAERLELLGQTAGQAEHLAVYGRLHLALDTFPYNGTTTLCEALWMGVPVLALRGERRAARVAESVLTALGPDLAELLVAKTPEDYVARAVGLLSDLPRLAALRQTIRPRMMASPLRDEAGFVQSLEAALLALAADKAGCG
jgi:hypothetical protein